MSPLHSQNILPGPSSQTTSVRIRPVALPAAHLGAVNVDAPLVHAPRAATWAATADAVLLEHADLWAKLAEM